MESRPVAPLAELARLAKSVRGRSAEVGEVSQPTDTNLAGVITMLGVGFTG